MKALAFILVLLLLPGASAWAAPAWATPAWATPAEALLQQINAYRESRGLAALEPSPRLQAAAARHNADMAAEGYFAHTSPQGTRLRDRLEAQGYAFRFAAENLAGGQKTPAEVLRDWQDSPGHDANLLAADATHAGIAFLRNPGGRPSPRLWTLVVARPR